ncbi:MAG: hypothetical protein ACYTFI_02140 [Planctomycetota bacterium]
MHVPWEQLVLNADFVGLVECETAGGIVARFRIVESWKGPKARALVTIRMAVNYWGSQLPVALCGERYVVAAYKYDAPDTIGSTALGGVVPLWWRNIAADYAVALGQGFDRVMSDGTTLFRYDGAEDFERENLDVCRSAVRSVLALGPEEQELLLLKKLVGRSIPRPLGRAEESGPGSKAGEILRKIRSARSPGELLGLLSALGETGNAPPVSFARVLRGAGRAATLKVVEGSPPGSLGLSDWSRKDVVRTIRIRLGLPHEPQDEEEKEEDLGAPPTEQKLGEMRKRLVSGSWDHALIPRLVRHDPATMAGYLAGWEPEGLPGDSDSGYEIGSYFAWQCRKDKERHLRTLLKAHDPYIRVAAAVYLCFENRKLGVRWLRKLSKLKGDPGVWAALTLARRGHASAMPRVLELFAPTGRENEEGIVIKSLLLDRVYVLLSNTCKASAIPYPQPPPLSFPEQDDDGDFDDVSYQKSVYRYYVRWWRENRKRAVLSDPWFPILEKQKVD